MVHIFDFITQYYKLYLAGAGSTVLISFFTVIFGVILGVFFALMKMSKNKILKYISSAFIEIVRGTPLLVQVMILFYGLPTVLQEYGIQFPEIDMMGIDFVAFVSVIIALTINSTAYIAEIIRGGIQSIDKGQMEAARCLGLSNKLAMRKIIIPQAIKNILPALGNEFITVIKESAIVSIVGIKEIMFNARVITGMTFEFFIPYIVAAIVYFILTFVLSKLLGYAERRMKVSD
ncbi:amino acid ABC transporter permease [Clostridium ganghwense]|uniref:Amino acid ABC transporter permease n=1 Tax=Clostridium ganghwense TaxID=312089 RepID=A0ABT4CSQ0_9CLOT|nr:amino acid ABC transporter permease [Clostridium ganghwense]MCY6372098.1 amino acid ABC transporter permease [Clostridium ganghwense]